MEHLNTEHRSAAPQQRVSSWARHLRAALFVILGVICVSAVLVWPAAPAALVGAARAAGRSLRRSAVGVDGLEDQQKEDQQKEKRLKAATANDPTVQFRPASVPVPPMFKGVSDQSRPRPPQVHSSRSFRPVPRSAPHVVPYAKVDGTDPGPLPDGPGDFDMDNFWAIVNEKQVGAVAVESDKEFDGFQFRDLIVAKWGVAYDVQIKREVWLGKPMIFFNVMWKYLGQQSFHLSEQEYLEHLQALAELCLKWDRVDKLKAEIGSQRKRPNAYFGYAVALPLDLPAEIMDELNIPESQ